MKIDAFKAELEALTGQISELIESMPDKGLTSEDSQKCALRIALSDLEANITGIEPFDLVPIPSDIEHLVDRAERDFNKNPTQNVYRVGLSVMYLSGTWDAIECVVVAPERSMVTESHPAIKQLLEVDQLGTVEDVQLLHGSDQFVIYSANEASTNDGRGFWNSQSGWTWLADADLFDEAEVKNTDLPLSLGNDRKCVRFNEASASCE
jgi:hypothetical protein